MSIDVSPVGRTKRKVFRCYAITVKVRETLRSVVGQFSARSIALGLPVHVSQTASEQTAFRTQEKPLGRLFESLSAASVRFFGRHVIAIGLRYVEVVLCCRSPINPTISLFATPARISICLHNSNGKSHTGSASCWRATPAGTARIRRIVVVSTDE